MERRKEVERHISWINDLVPEIRPGAIHNYVQIPYFQDIILGMMESHHSIHKADLLSAMEQTLEHLNSIEWMNNGEICFSFVGARRTIRKLREVIESE